MQEFFVANNRVDISRNRIIREGEIITLEPKVLEVLQVLAEHQGDVVTHQTLLDAVWPNSVVAPNALQRCIGQLRKAFGDDGKTQRVIATHPKRGYSLIAPVTHRSTFPAPDENRPSNTVSPTITTWKNSGLLRSSIALLAAIGVLLIINRILPSGSTSLQDFTQLNPLTATDASEFYSTFSPDGHHVAFSRNAKGLLAHMWVLDRETGKEVRVTDKPGRYGKPSWSTDGKQMAFLDLDACTQDCPAAKCAVVNQIFVPLAMNQPQAATPLTPCADIPFLGVEWLSDKDIAVIINTHDQSEIVRINSQSGHRESLFKTGDARLYSLSYSPLKRLLAVMQVHQEQSPSMFLFAPHSRTITDQVFTPPTRYSSSVRWAPVWGPAGNSFLFSASSHLYLMDLQGTLHSQSIPTFEDISYPMFHPQGHSIAMTLGKVDRDIAELQLTEPDTPQYANSYTETPFARSILRENHAQYQPRGNKVAFFSRRDGTRQIWLEDNGEVIQLSHLQDVFPEFFVWSPNGRQIAVSTEHLLQLIDLEGNAESLSLSFAIKGLYQWLPQNKLLMQIVDTDGPKLVSYDIRQNTYQTLQNAQSIWAQAHDENTWFVDSELRLKSIHGGKAKIVATSAKVETGTRFFYRDEQLFILASDDHIWQLNLNSNELKRLFHYPDTTLQLTDVSIDGQRLLISKQLSAKKEIVLLTP